MKPQELQGNNSMLALPSHLIHLKHLMHFWCTWSTCTCKWVNPPIKICPLIGCDKHLVVIVLTCVGLKDSITLVVSLILSDHFSLHSVQKARRQLPRLWQYLVIFGFLGHTSIWQAAHYYFGSLTTGGTISRLTRFARFQDKFWV